MASWKQLSTKQSPNGATLYVKAVFSESSYAIYISDLVRIWAERLDRRAIMRRAMDENTTIDPTNGPDQLHQLLKHIGKCFQGDAGTRAVVSSKSEMQALRLTLTSELPAPLEPLRWPMILGLDDQACFSSELLRPALTSLQDYRQGLNGLLSVIKEKDNVIRKLQDKLEVAGVDIGAAFSGVGSGKASKASSAAFHRAFPGLTEFNYESWIQHSSGLQHEPLANDQLPRPTDVVAPKLDPWWENLPASDAEVEELVPDSQVKEGSGTQFSVPERQKSPRRGSASSTSTEDFASANTEERDLQSKDCQPEIVAESLEQANDVVSKTNPPKGAETTKPGKRIGKLGGKKAAPDPQHSEDTTGHDVNQDISPPKKVSKLGRLGGGPKSGDRTTNTGSEGQASHPAAAIKREPSLENDSLVNASHGAREERETSEERANRRRTELKRQLEDKKKVPGTKKKQRKF